MGCWLLGAILATPAFAGVALRLPPNVMVEGLAVGAATRSFEPATVGETLDAVRRAGAAVVEIHSGQSLSTNLTGSVVGESMTEEETFALRRQATAAGMRLVAARVRFGNNASSITRLFEWADRLGVQVLVGDPPTEQYDHVERMVRQYNIAVGLPTGTASASGRGGAGRSGWTDPQAVLAALRGRDLRIGVVVNVLNLVRAGEDPFEALEELRSRLMGVQVVDLSELTAKARPVPFGTGVFDFRRMLAALHAHQFDGYVVFDPPPDTPAVREDLRAGLAMFRKEMASIRRASSLRQAGRGTVVSEGLRYEVLTQGDIPEPVRVAQCPDGSVWFASRRGMLWAWSPEARTNLLVARFPVSTSGQRGLYGFEFDGGFLTNGFLYVYRAPILSEGNSNRVSRFTAKGGRGAWRVGLETERVLLDVPSSSHGLQQGGGLLLNPKDHMLYVGTGDNLLPNETPRVYDDPMSWPQDRGDLRGKILRVAPDGSIPPGNPWVATAGARPEVFAIGLRNPVTLAWDGRSETVLVGDVGYDRMRDQEEVNRVEAGANYGWPRCDGRHRETLSGGACPLADAVGPWFSYAHDSAAAVMVGGTVDRPPAGWPDRFGHGMLYSDFSRRVVRFAQIDAGQNLVTNTVPIASGLAGGVLSMTLTAEGELYMVEYGGNLSGSPDDRLSRILPADR